MLVNGLGGCYQKIGKMHVSRFEHDVIPCSKWFRKGYLCKRCDKWWPLKVVKELTKGKYD